MATGPGGMTAPRLPVHDAPGVSPKLGRLGHGNRHTAGPVAQNAHQSLDSPGAAESAADITPAMSLQVSSLLPSVADLTS